MNYFRVLEVQKRLQDHEYDSKSVLAIGFECGFNSKTTFNTVFKKAVGKTPTQFRNKK